jgi:hypothetical protein
MTKCYVVWNAEKSEGVIFRDGPAVLGSTPEQDAQWAAGKRKKRGFSVSTLADNFNECYEDQKRSIEVREDL